MPRSTYVFAVMHAHWPFARPATVKVVSDSTVCAVKRLVEKYPTSRGFSHSLVDAYPGIPSVLDTYLIAR